MSWANVHAKQRAIVGERFGLLVVLGRIQDAGSKNSKWACQCDCGNFAVVQRTSLISGATIACGCRQGVRGPVRLGRPRASQYRYSVGVKKWAASLGNLTGVVPPKVEVPGRVHRILDDELEAA